MANRLSMARLCPLLGVILLLSSSPHYVSAQHQPLSPIALNQKKIATGTIQIQFDPQFLHHAQWSIVQRFPEKDSITDQTIPLELLKDSEFRIQSQNDSTWIARGDLVTRGAFVIHMGDQRITVRNAIVRAGFNGQWSLQSQESNLNDPPIFQISNILINFRDSTDRLQITGDLVVHPDWAKQQEIPQLANLSAGNIMITASTLSADLKHLQVIDEQIESTTNSGQTAGGVIGPDVIVSDLPSLIYNGTTGDTSSFALGTTSCNIGDFWLNWNANTNQHPVIAQNIYRLKEGRFEQIGMSWLKHGFFAISGKLCFSDCQATDGSHLGVHCSDPYSANLNASQSNLGPRWQVNGFTGEYAYPPNNPSYSGILARRIQVKNADLDESLNTGAQYFVEGHYVSPDDAAAGNQNNNASYRPLSVSGFGSNFIVNVTGTTQRQQPAILAWKNADPNVTITEITIPNEGLVILGAKATDMGNGRWAYDYALQNISSHRAIQSLKIPIDPDKFISLPSFHDVNYHSGELIDTTDWSLTTTLVSISWSSREFALSQFANALRWGTMYSFHFESNAPPQPSIATLGIFRPGTPESVQAMTIGPITNAQDCNLNDIPDSLDIAEETSWDCNQNNIPDECEEAQPITVLVADGFTKPVFITAAPGDADKLFIVEQTGRIKIILNNEVIDPPFLDLSSLTTSSGERGLFSMAFHPNHASNGYFYVNYTNLDGHTVIARYSVSGNPFIADASSAVVIKFIEQDASNHNGGQLQFGPDGYLYVGMGDGGGALDALNRAQDTGSLLGKMLRLDVDLPPDYIPIDNPFVFSTLPLDEIWAMGLRNPWRFSFDRETGDLYIADVGQDDYEEIDFQSANSSGGENYGWRCMEGLMCTGLTGCTCDDSGLTLPIFEYDQSAGDCSITGGYVYRGCAFPNLLGHYFYSDFCTGSIKSFRFVDGNIMDATDWTQTFATPSGPIPSITSFGEDANGELYIASFNGSIYKIIPDTAICGNSKLEGNEQCDDGNLTPGDGCDENCDLEAGVANNDCTNKITISDGIFQLNNSTATTDGPVETSACGFAGDTQIESDLWFCYTASCSGTTTIDLCNSTFDTRVAVYNDCTCPTESAATHCNDDGCGIGSSLSFPTQACQSYLIRVGGALNAQGSSVMDISCDPAPLTIDCNGNETNDADDIACHTSTDGNSNGIPDECETVGDFIEGGRLYDRWWAELALNAPIIDHPLWAYRPDTLSNTRTGSATWRCKECHGWDYKGVTGAYNNGSHRTGFAGITQTTLEVSEIFALLKEPPSNGGEPGILNGHDYGSVIADPAINDLVAFVLSGKIDVDVYIDPITTEFMGDEAVGLNNYRNQGSPSCVTCHGLEGTSINFNTYENPEYLGTIAVHNPWELMHKIRFAQPAAPMPSWTANGGMNQGVADIGKYIQTNFPVDCLFDDQCDDGVDCTIDQCLGGLCVIEPDDALCPTDGIYCNGPEVCDSILGCINPIYPCSGPCDEVNQCVCEPPLVETAGSRYLAITPQPSGAGWPVALVVNPECNTDRKSFVGMPNGVYNIAHLMDDPADAAWLSFSEWGETVYVSGLDIVPDTTYEVRADCGIQQFPSLSTAQVTTTYMLGDSSSFTGGSTPGPPNQKTDIYDILRSVDGFLGLLVNPTLYALDQFGCLPDQKANIIDVLATVDAFLGHNYASASLCPLPCP